MGTRKHRRRRRGVVLLIILGILAMFGMLVLAFLLVAGNNKRAAIEDQRIDEQSAPPDELLREAGYQVLRGERGRGPLRDISLLEDVYSSGVFYGQMVSGIPAVNPGNPVTAVRSICNGQLIEFHLANSVKDTVNNVRVYQIVGAPYAYVGRVLTMRSGPAAGESTRIVNVGFDTVNNLLMLQILPFENVPTAVFVADIQALGMQLPPQPQSRGYIINGMAFSGTGVGYNPNTVSIRSPDLLGDVLPVPNPNDPFLQFPFPFSPAGLPYALLPNRAGDPPSALDAFDLVNNPSDPTVFPMDLTGRGGANEDYDAVDYQNPLLAMVEPGGTVPIPSLHRPALINYWYNRLVTEWLMQAPLSLSEVDAWRAVLQPEVAETRGLINSQVRDAIIGVKRRIFFRPLVEINGNFSGSNPRWQAWEQEDIFNTTNYPTVVEVRDQYWLQQSPVLNGPWDVDTDGDGRNDSIWVDLGMPVRTAADGRRYKPLFGILCADMDGRLNINAQGTVAQAGEWDDNQNGSLDPGEDHNHNGVPDVYGAQVNASPFLFADGTGVGSPTARLARSQGYGPPEINLGPLFNTGVPLEDRRQMLALMLGAEVHQDPGNPRWVDGRYGEAFPLATPGDVNLDFLPDDFREVQPGRSFAPGTYNRGDPNMLLAADPLARNKHFELASMVSYNNFGIPTAYGTPPDFKATMAIGLDVRGLPMYWTMADPGVNTRVAGPPVWFDRFAWMLVNSPYEMNLSRNATRAVKTPARLDHPFSAYELERVLRQYDFDAGGLADRLPLLAAALMARRTEITTDSWDVPTLGVAGVSDSQGAGATPTFRRFGHFTGLLRTRLQNPALNRPDLWPQFVAPELLAGLRMNLNRPFGNGIDDNGNGVVDEAGLIFRSAGQYVFLPTVPSEVTDPANPGAVWEQVPWVDAGGNGFTFPFDHSNGVDVDGDGNDLNADGVPDLDRVAVDRAMARELYARHLYLLAIMLSDDIYDPSGRRFTWSPDEARRLAQWAVNVVDFRDRDSIMTRFNYDSFPGGQLDGWAPAAADVVWGCERPELLFSETTAFHDRRTQDLATDPSGETSSSVPPDDFDSRIHPQGSLFIELHNPQTAQEHLPGEFCYDLASGAFSPGVRLNQATPQGDPVWRMLIAEEDGNPDTDPNFEEGRMDPDSPDPSLYPTVDRSVYFIQPSGPYGDGASVQYYPSNTNLAPVMPGRYAVIGPADSGGATPGTYMGFQLADVDWDGAPPPRRIELTPDPDPTVPQVAVYANDVTQPDVQSIPIPAQPAVAVVMDRTAAGALPGRTEPRFSISEPTNGYPVYTDQVNNEFNPPLDHPLDDPANPNSGDMDLWDQAQTPRAQTKGIRYEGTSRRFRIIYLQRLANPLAPWDADYNPYRTVDSMQVDLTTFNGMVTADDVVGLILNVASDEFYSFQRGYGTQQQADPARRQNLWADEPETEVDPIPIPSRGVHPVPVVHFFGSDFAHTLGRLNAWFGTPRGPDPVNDPGGIYIGDPADNPADPTDGPFAWLTWLNRPFVNRMELMLVPDKRSSQLLRNLTIGQEGNDPYVSPTDPLSVDPPGPLGNLSFQHLRPFFGTPMAYTPAAGPPPPDPPSRLYRVLDFVCVPSRFVGTEVQGNPGVFSAYSAGPGLPFPFRPPFNGISLYREPGRMNLNTIFSPDVWNGLMNFFQPMSGAATGYWAEMIDSRRGYGASGAGMLASDSAFPTRFANPFRSFAGASLAPIPDPAQVAAGATPPVRDEIHGTLLRKLDPSAADSGGADMPLFIHQSADPAQQTARNPYFRYQLLQRLGGLTTTRSNVYAVWITLGFFEVEEAPAIPAGWSPAQYQAVYPSGYRLGQELGSDTGEIKRHRAFYLFDRSIPVGFERGRDINVKNAILLERFIE